MHTCEPALSQVHISKHQPSGVHSSERNQPYWWHTGDGIGQAELVPVKGLLESLHADRPVAYQPGEIHPRRAQSHTDPAAYPEVACFYLARRCFHRQRPRDLRPVQSQFLSSAKELGRAVKPGVAEVSTLERRAAKSCAPAESRALEVDVFPEACAEKMSVLREGRVVEVDAVLEEHTEEKGGFSKDCFAEIGGPDPSV
jgi:hypothetical protein